VKLSRDESGTSLIKKLSNLGYKVSRQKGSHIRLSKITDDKEHHITIPNHDPIKIGLLVKILNDVSLQLGVSRDKLLEMINK